MDGNEEPGSMRRDHRVTEARTKDKYDRQLDDSIGLPGGAHTKVAAVQHRTFYGDATTYNIQSVLVPEEGVTTFVTQVDAGGAVRFILPTRVLAAIDRQRKSLTKQVRRRNGQRIAEERAAQGIKPGFMQKK